MGITFCFLSEILNSFHPVSSEIAHVLRGQFLNVLKVKTDKRLDIYESTLNTLSSE